MINAIYNALFHDNRDKSKAMMVFTIGDEKVASLIKLRREIMAKLNSLLKRKEFKGQKVAYFTNIEFGEDKGELVRFNPHIHIQFFYDDVRIIHELYDYIVNKYDFTNSDLKEANNKNAYFGYIVKDYFISNLDMEFEARKKKYANGKPYYTASRKAISNYVIRYIYGYLRKHLSDKWTALEADKRYQFILDNIREGNILVKTLDEDYDSRYEVVKNRAILIDIDSMGIDKKFTIKKNIQCESETEVKNGEESCTAYNPFLERFNA